MAEYYSTTNNHRNRALQQNVKSVKSSCALQTEGQTGILFNFKTMCESMFEKLQFATSASIPSYLARGV
jgi:hypothetical protein